jgi:DNA-binding MltR family transcriptional regulator
MPKRNQAQIEQQLGDFRGMVDEIQKEGDRAAIIVGAAYLDEYLRIYIASFLIDESKVVDDLFGIERPLGTFGARIRMAYALGLLAVDEFHDFKIVQEVRNAFAHGLHGLSFADQWVADRCRAFILPQKSVAEVLLPAASPRDLFLWTIMELAVSMAKGQFDISSKEEQRKASPPRQWRRS